MEKTNKKIERVAFFGDGQAMPNENCYQLAMDTAELLALNGYIMVNGGGPGIMLAASQGAKKGKGKVELVIIDPKKVPQNYEGTNKNNLQMASKIYKTDNIEFRASKLIEIADAFVIFKGGTGTLAEMSLVWEKAKFEYGHHEPVIFVGEEWGEVIKMIENKMELEDIEKKVISIVKTPEEVLKALVEAGN